MRFEQCKLGVLAGQEGLDCYGNSTEYFKNCCEACKIGLVIGATSSECENTIEYGHPFDASYTYCCNEMNLSMIQPDGENGL